MKHPFILLYLLPLLFGCQQHIPSEADAPAAAPATKNRLVLSDEQLKNISVNMVSLEKKQVAGTLHLTGKVDVNPDDRVSLSSALGGRVRAVNALPGRAVKKGAVIVELEDNQFIQLQQDYLATKATLSGAEANYRRQTALNASQSASDRAAELAETEYQTLLAAKSALEEKLRLININPAALTADNMKRSVQLVAPFDGVVSSVLVNKGRYVSPSEVLVELINPRGLLLNIKVFENDWPKVADGQLIEAYTNGAPDKKITARIIATGNAINDDGSTSVIARIVDANSVKLVAGLYINAQLKLDQMDAYVLPEDAVVSYGGGRYVFERVNENTFQLMEVTSGEPQDGTVAIMNAEALQGKTIVGTGAYALLMALKNTADE